MTEQTIPGSNRKPEICSVESLAGPLMDPLKSRTLTRDRKTVSVEIIWRVGHPGPCRRVRPTAAE
jgi:hypothetical protein